MEVNPQCRNRSVTVSLSRYERLLGYTDEFAGQIFKDLLIQMKEGEGWSMYTMNHETLRECQNFAGMESDNVPECQSIPRRHLAKENWGSSVNYDNRLVKRRWENYWEIMAAENIHIKQFHAWFEFHKKEGFAELSGRPMLDIIESCGKFTGKISFQELEDILWLMMQDEGIPEMEFHQWFELLEGNNWKDVEDSPIIDLVNSCKTYCILKGGKKI